MCGLLTDCGVGAAAGLGRGVTGLLVALAYTRGYLDLFPFNSLILLLTHLQVSLISFVSPFLQ